MLFLVYTAFLSLFEILHHAIDLKSALPSTSHFEFFDIQRVSDKFPDAQSYLHQRLGKANVRRRQLLQYYRMHHNKISERGPPILAVAGTVVTKKTETTISIYPAKLVADIDMDACSVTDQSCTSFSSSATGTDAHPLRVPAMPEVDSGVHSFQCPICFDIVSIRGGQSSWKRHVFRDIRPYMCTFPACVKLEHLFGNQHEWFEYELEYHRRSWHCNQCNQTFSSVETFKKHLQRAHPDSFSEEFLPTIIERCTRPDESPQICPLCGEIQTFNRLQRHLGSHLQQIALFVLRVSEDLEEEGGSDVAIGVSED
ncbi:hypothetical protein K440DRAFT_596463, partial [Wilcoxina mikolae CBS 423.85]